MKSGRGRYLSSRIFVLGISAALLIGFLSILCLTAAASGAAPAWPFAVGVLGLVLLLVLSFFLVVKPYYRMERNVLLFLDGYTTSNPAAAGGVQTTPAGERMMERIQGMLDSAELLKLNKRQAQYLALQNQINPHFLYNTLESIRSEALIAGLNGVADMTEALSSFFRYTISKVENLVSVEEELANCETYFRIQQYRFGERLRLNVDCDPQEWERIYGCRLPKLTLQPILENSIIHGTELKVGTGHLTIRLERTGKRLLIRISDDGVGMDAQTLAKMNERLTKSAGALAGHEAESGGGIALMNVNNRIHLLFGEEYGLHVYSMPDVGTDVEIILPAILSDREIQNKDALG